MKRHILFIFCILLSSIAFAQQPKEDSADGIPLYVGAQWGLPVGVASFTGLNADFSGTEAGIFVGYSFDKMMSVELDASFGQLNMLPRSFCREFFWDEAAGIQYMRLKNKTFTHRYTARFNFNVLQLFTSTIFSPWRAEISPSISLLGRSGKIVRLAEETEQLGESRGFNFGYGCRLGTSYAFGNYLVGAYIGCTQYTGSAIDGLQKTNANYVAEVGARFTYEFTANFRSADKRGNTRKETVSVVAPIPASVPDTIEQELPDTVIVQEPQVKVLTLDERRLNAHSGLAGYSNAVMNNVVSFVDSLLNSAVTYEDYLQKVKWLDNVVLPEIRGYEQTADIVSRTDSASLVLSKILNAESLLEVVMQKDSVRAMSAELASLETDKTFVADRISSLRTLLNRYYLTTTWALDIIERMEAVRHEPDMSKQVSEIFTEYSDNGRLAMIREIPYMNGIMDQLLECVNDSDWTKVTAIKTSIETSRK